MTYILDVLGLSLLVLTPIAYGWKPDGAPLHLWRFYAPGIVLLAIANWR